MVEEREDSDRKGRGRGVRRALRWLALLGLWLVVAVAALVLALDRGWQRERIVGIALTMAEERLGVDVSIDAAVGRLSRGIDLRGVRVGEPGEPPLARADSIRLRWQLRSLLSGERWIADRVRIEGWSLSARRRADGSWASWDDLLQRLGSPEQEPGDAGNAGNVGDVGDAGNVGDAGDAGHGSTDGRPGPRLLVRAIEIGEGTLDLVVEPRPTTRGAEASGGIPLTSEAPLRASFRAEGEIHELETGPIEPVTVETARLQAVLETIETGRADFDAQAQARLELSILGSRIESLVVDARAPGLEVQARASGEGGRPDRLTLEVEASDLQPLSGWLQTSIPLRGELHARAELSGSPAAVQGSLALEARSLHVEGLRARELEIDLEVDDPVVLEALRGLPRDASPLWTWSGRLRLHGRGLDPGPLGRDWLPADTAADEGEIDLEASLTDGTLELREGSLRLAGLTLDARGRGSREQIEELDLRFEVLDVEPWLRGLPLDALPFEPSFSGGLEGEARLEGPPRSPLGRIRLHSQSLAWAGQALGPLESSVMRREGAPLEAALLWGSEGDPALQASARIDPSEERIDFRVSGRATPFMALVPGSLSLEADVGIEGHVERTPQGLAHALTMRSGGTVVDGRSLGRIELVTHGESTRRLEISTLEIDGSLGGLSLREATTLELKEGGAWQLPPAAFTLALESSAELDVAGDAGDKAAGEDGGKVAGKAADEDGGKVAGKATGDAETRTAELRVEADGRLTDLDGLELRVDAFPMALVHRFRPESVPALAGRLTGRASWHRQRRPGWTAGELTWTDPKLGELEVDRLTGRWSATAEAIEFALQTQVAELSPLLLEGRIETPESEAGLAELLASRRLSLRAVLEDWDLAALQPFAPRWMRRIAGRANGTLRLDRDDSGLRLGGEARLVEGGVTVPLLRQRFTPIEGRLSFDHRSLRIESLRVGGAEEHASLTGSVRFPEEGSPEIEGTLVLERFPLSRSRVASMDVLGEVRLDGTLARPVVRGEVAVAEARIGVPAADDPILKEIRVATGSTNGGLTEAAPGEREPFDGADVDVTFRVPGSTRVRGQGANLFVEGDARVVKLPGEAVRIRGEARVVNGTYTFQGRRFRVQRGRVLLTGDQRLDPVLDVEARLPVAEIVAIVEISGRLSSPVVRLRSEPPRSDQDVLAYLLFGRPADEVGAAGGTRFEAAAARLVAGVAERELREVLGDAMPVDAIEIGADEEGNTSELGFGKYLSRNLYFRYVHVLGDEPADRVGAEYRLNDNFSIGSSVSTTGEAGLDLILRHDF